MREPDFETTRRILNALRRGVFMRFGEEEELIYPFEEHDEKVFYLRFLVPEDPKKGLKADLEVLYDIRPDTVEIVDKLCEFLHMKRRSKTEFYSAVGTSVRLYCSMPGCADAKHTAMSALRIRANVLEMLRYDYALICDVVQHGRSFRSNDAFAKEFRSWLENYEK